jgi:hypothetical protein
MVLRRSLKGDCVVEKGKKTARARDFKSAERKRLISAVDARGIAAFIGPAGLLAGLGFPSEAAAYNQRDFYSVLLNKDRGN